MEKETRPHVRPGAIKYTRGYGWKLLTERIKQVFLALIVLSIVGGAVFTFIKQPVRTSDGFVFAELSNNKHIIGEEVLVVRGDSYNMFTPLLRVLFEQDIYKAKIVAGPYGQVKPNGEVYKVVYRELSVDVNIIGDEIPEFLDDEYVVRSGDNTELPDEVVSKDFILGFVK